MAVHVDVVADMFIEFATYVGVYFFFTYVQAAPKNDVPPPEIERTCYAVAVDGIAVLEPFSIFSTCGRTKRPPGAEAYTRSGKAHIATQ